MLLAALSCSFVSSGGVVKDVGRWVLDSHIAGEAWMPTVVGGMFLPVFCLAVWILNQIPEPNAADISARTLREPMTAVDRRAFVHRFLTGLLPLGVVAFFIMAYRDYCDNFGVGIFARLGYGNRLTLSTRSELVVAFRIMAMLALLSLVRENRTGVLATYAIVAGGTVLMGVATLLLDTHCVGGLTWMILIGLGSYMTYVPFGSVFFDQLIARTRFVGTAVFGSYVIDSIGYTGSIGVQLFKDLGEKNIDPLTFFRFFTYGLSIAGTLLLRMRAAYLLRSSIAVESQVNVAGDLGFVTAAPGDL